MAFRTLLADVLPELARADERDELRAQEDADQQRGGPRDQHAAHQPASAACASASATASRPTPREAFTSTASPARTSLGTSVAACAASATTCDSPANASAVARLRSPTATSSVHAARGRVRADLGVEARLLRPELEHVAEHRDAARLAGGRGEVVEGRAHGHRVGVVAVVDDGDTALQAPALAAPSAERDRHRAAWSDPDRACGGDRREQVPAQVLLLEVELQPDPLAARVDRDVAFRRLRDERDVAAGAEHDGREVVAAVWIEQRLVRRDHGGAVRGQVGDQLRLGGRDRLDRAEQLEVRRADVDDHADVGLGDVRQLGDLAGAAHAHLQHERLGALRCGEQLQRQPDLRVEVAAADERPAMRRQQRGEDVLRRGLAGRAGDRDRLGAERAAPCAGERLERGERVVGGEQDAGGRAFRVLGVRGRDEHAPGACRERLRGEAAAVVRLAGQADEQVARGDVARVDRDASGTRGVRRRRGEPRAGRLGDPLGRSRTSSREDAPERLARDRHVVERDLARRRRAPAPARGPCRRSRRRRPRCASAIACPIARAAVDLAHRTPCRRRRGSRAMIASGSSERGLSDVTIVRSARRAAISPISGRLPLSRSPPQPNTHHRRPSGERARGVEDVLERVGRVRVVDEHGERLALVDRLEAAGHAPGVRQRRGDPRRAGRRARAPRRRAPSTFETLKRPGQRRAQLRSVPPASAR